MLVMIRWLVQVARSAIGDVFNKGEVSDDNMREVVGIENLQGSVIRISGRLNFSNFFAFLLLFFDHINSTVFDNSRPPT